MQTRFLTHLGIISFLHVALLLGGVGFFVSEMKSSGKKLPGAVQVSLGGTGPKSGTPAPMITPKKELKTLTQRPPLSPQVIKSANASQIEAQNMAPSQEVGLPSASGNGQAPNAVAGSSRDTYKAELRARIDQNKTYPMMSRRLGQTGTVVVAFTMLKDGSIINVRIEEPAPFSALNKSALEAVNKVGKFKPIPDEFHEEKMDLSIPIKFMTI